MHQLLDSKHDLQRWNEVLAAMPPDVQDVYFRPDYCALEVVEQKSRAKAFVFEQDGLTWFYPFLLSKIGIVGDLAFNEDYFDIESQYGYGGPIANTNQPDFLTQAHAEFEKWCKEANIVAEFLRLHPILQNERWLDPHVEVVYDRPTVSLDLAKDTDAPIESLISKTSRYMIRRAESGGLRVDDGLTAGSFEKFVQLYLGTMDRLGADRYYYFDKSYFERLRDLVENSGWLLTIVAGGDAVAAAVILKGNRWLHYHLSATAAGKRFPGATNLLIRKAAQLGRTSGYSRLHLGGGASASQTDSLLAFKESMATDRHRYNIGKRVHNEGIYELLKSSWVNANPSLVERFGARLLCYRIGMTNQ